MWILVLLFFVSGAGALAYLRGQQRRDEELEAAATPLVQPPPAGNVFERGSALIAEFETLETFADVRAWDLSAERAIEALRRFSQSVDEFEKEAKTAIVRAVSGDEYAARRTNTLVGFAREAALRAGRLADELAERVEYSPNDLEDQKEILWVLRTSKQELTLEKREVRADVAEIRREARIASANAAPVFPVRGAAKWAAAERRSIRRQKERALRPHEDAIEALSRQILDIDRRIVWVKRFRKDR